MKKKIFIIIICSLLSSFFFAQEALNSNEEKYYKFLSLTGEIENPTLGYRTLSDSIWIFNSENEHIWQNLNLGTDFNLINFNNDNDNWFLKGINKSIKFKLYGPENYFSYNPHIPYGQYDGALWQGVGFNTSFTTGIHLEGFGFEFTFKPQITWSQNLPFNYLPGVYGDTHSYFWSGNIDYVQRFGDNPYWQFDFGDSEIRFNFYNVTLGFGTESPWIGPAYINPMLGSNNAGTYPKFDIGFRKTDIIIPGKNWNFGKFESRIWIGQLSESNYFDNNPDNNNNLLSGFNISYSPPYFNDFTIGATKICITKWGNEFWKYLNPFYSTNDIYGVGEDQKLEIYINWSFPKVGFNVYFEYGMDDNSFSVESNPFHTGIFTFGFNKSINVKNYRSEVLFEFNNFEMSQDFQLQWHYMGYYSHGKITQGYTNKGQIIGNGYSPFGNSQYLGYKIYNKRGYFLIFFNRFCPDVNYILNKGLDTIPNSEEANKYYSIYKTFITLGLENLTYINKNLYIQEQINVSRVLFDNYDINNTFYNTFHINLSIKYIF